MHIRQRLDSMGQPVSPPDEHAPIDSSRAGNPGQALSHTQDLAEVSATNRAAIQPSMEGSYSVLHIRRVTTMTSRLIPFMAYGAPVWVFPDGGRHEVPADSGKHA